MLQEEITKWMRGHEKEEQYLQGFKSVMERIAAQEAFAPLGDSLRAMAKSAQILNESTHEVVCERPEKQLLSMLAQVQYQAIVPIKVRKQVKRSRNTLKSTALETIKGSRQCKKTTDETGSRVYNVCRKTESSGKEIASIERSKTQSGKCRCACGLSYAKA